MILKNGAPACNCCGDACQAVLCVGVDVCECLSCAGVEVTATGPAGTLTGTTAAGSVGGTACAACFGIAAADFGSYTVSATDPATGNSDSATVLVDSCGSPTAVLDLSGGVAARPTLALTLPDGGTLTLARSGGGREPYYASDEWTGPYSSTPTLFEYMFNECSGALSVCVSAPSNPLAGYDGTGTYAPEAPGPCADPIAVAATIEPYFGRPGDPFAASACYPRMNGGTIASSALQARFGPGPWTFLVDG